MIRRASFILIAFLLIPWAAHAGDTVGVPDVAIGDFWKYRTIDGYTKETTGEFSYRIVKMDDKQMAIQTQSSGSKRRGLIYVTKELNRIDDGNSKWQPFSPFYKFPMHVGMAWQQEFSSSHENGGLYTGIAKMRVTGIEKITVPAGTYNAYRIERDMEARRVGPSGTVEKGRTIYWYAPEIKSHVRMESTNFRDGRERSSSVIELLESSLQVKPPSAGASQ